jgi:hypothetical protein
VASSSRHRSVDSPAASPRAAQTTPSRTTCYARIRYQDGLWLEVADGVVHRGLRVAPPAPRYERGESRPVADKHDCSPVGEGLLVDAIVALFRARSVQNLGRRNGLAAVDDS